MRALAVIALLLALLVIASVGIAATRGFNLASELSEATACGDHEMQERIRKLMHAGVDEAFQDHIKRTFESWMRDETQQPSRAVVGIRKGVNAYVRSRKAVENWKLMTC